MTSRPAIVTVASPTSLLLLPLAEEPGEEQMTQPPTAQKATGNQNAREPVILTAAAAFLLFFSAHVLFFVPLA